MSTIQASNGDEHALTPTQELICAVLTARHRLGEPFWPIEKRNKAALDALVDIGVVSYMSGWGPSDYRARLTEHGKREFMHATYTAPVFDPNCRSFYIGPKTNEFRVDCTLAAGHKKKHRTEASRVVPVVKWTDAEAGGYASAVYGDQLRAADAERDAEQEAANRGS